MKKMLSCLLAAGLSLSLLTPAVSAVYVPPGEAPFSVARLFPTASNAAGVASFAAVEERMRDKNPSILALEEQLQQQLSFDLKKTREDLMDGIDDLTEAAQQLRETAAAANMALQAAITAALNPVVPPTGTMPGTPPFVPSVADIATMLQKAQEMETAAEEMRTQLDKLDPADYEKTTARLRRQISGAIDQIVFGGESLYLSAFQVEQQYIDTERNLDTLARSIEEMHLRYERGQVSQLAVHQLEAQMTAAQSGLVSLASVKDSVKASLAAMLGESPQGNFRLGGLPLDTLSDSAVINRESDLTRAQRVNFSLYQAGVTLEDAQETWEEACDDFSKTDSRYAMAEHAWKAAQNTYDAAVQSFRLSFYQLAGQLDDARQTRDAARAALAQEQENCQAVRTKYDLGLVAKNALLSAEDSLYAKERALLAADIKLFSLSNSYRWAVERGVLNAQQG